MPSIYRGTSRIRDPNSPGVPLGGPLDSPKLHRPSDGVFIYQEIGHVIHEENSCKFVSEIEALPVIFLYKSNNMFQQLGPLGILVAPSKNDAAKHGITESLLHISKRFPKESSLSENIVFGILS